MLKNFRIIIWIMIAVISSHIAYGYFNKPEETNEQTESVISQFGGPFELVRHDGTPISEQDLSGRAHALFFGFTHCPEVCPTTLFEASGWLEELGAAAGQIDFYFITVDPERDTQPVLSEYMQAFDARITGITGGTQNINKLLSAYKIHARKVALEDGDYTMDHSASVLLFRRNGSFLGTISFGEASRAAIAKLRRLLDDG